MANIKITDLTAYTDAASTDVLPIVDVGADVTKKIAIGDIVKAVPQGTAALPGLAFDGDPNSGIYSPGADQVAFSTNGVGRLFIDSTGRVGIGTASPNYSLDVASTGSISASFTSTDSENYIALKDSGTTLGHVRVGSISNELTFRAGNSERVRIDSSGKLLIGTSTSTGSNSDLVQSHNTTGNNYAAGRFNNTGGGSDFNFYKSRGTSVGTNTTVQNNDVFGNIAFLGANDSTYLVGALISAAVDGVVTGGGASDMPGRLVFSTTADGSSSPTERMRIKASGIVNIANTPTYADNTAALAGGLVAGDIYRKSDGTLMITY